MTAPSDSTLEKQEYLVVSDAEKLHPLLGDSMEKRGTEVVIASPPKLKPEEYKSLSESLRFIPSEKFEMKVPDVSKQESPLLDEVKQLTLLRTVEIKRREAEQTKDDESFAMMKVFREEKDGKYKGQEAQASQILNVLDIGLQMYETALEDPKVADVVAGSLKEELVHQMRGLFVKGVSDHLLEQRFGASSTADMRWETDAEMGSLITAAAEIAKLSGSQIGNKFEMDQLTNRFINDTLVVIGRYNKSSKSIELEHPKPPEYRYIGARSADIARTMVGIEFNDEIVENGINRFGVRDLLNKPAGYGQFVFHPEAKTFKRTERVHPGDVGSRNSPGLIVEKNGEVAQIGRTTYIDNLVTGFLAANTRESTRKSRETVEKFRKNATDFAESETGREVMELLDIMRINYNDSIPETNKDRVAEISAEDMYRISIALTGSMIARQMDSRYKLDFDQPVNKLVAPTHSTLEPSNMNVDPDVEFAAGLNNMRILMDKLMSVTSTEGLGVSYDTFKLQLSASFVHTALALQACDRLGYMTSPRLVALGEKIPASLVLEDKSNKKKKKPGLFS